MTVPGLTNAQELEVLLGFQIMAFAATHQIKRMWKKRVRRTVYVKGAFAFQAVVNFVKVTVQMLNAFFTGCKRCLGQAKTQAGGHLAVQKFTDKGIIFGEIGFGFWVAMPGQFRHTVFPFDSSIRPTRSTSQGINADGWNDIQGSSCRQV